VCTLLLDQGTESFLIKLLDSLAVSNSALSLEVQNDHGPYWPHSHFWPLTTFLREFKLLLAPL
jgi:hypothetical protein